MFAVAGIILSNHFNIANYHADGSRGVSFWRRLCVCSFVFPHDISKTNAAYIAKRDADMFHHDSW